MRTLFTFFILSLISQILPAQGIIFSSSVDSFLLCTSAKTEDGNFIGHVDSQLGGYTGTPGNPLPDPFYIGSWIVRHAINQCQKI